MKIWYGYSSQESVAELQIEDDDGLFVSLPSLNTILEQGGGVLLDSGSGRQGEGGGDLKQSTISQDWLSNCHSNFISIFYDRMPTTCLHGMEMKKEKDVEMLIKHTSL